MRSEGHKRYFTFTEAAKKLKITRAAVHEAIKKGKLQATWGKFIQVAEGWRISLGSPHSEQKVLFLAVHRLREKSPAEEGHPGDEAGSKM